MKPKTRKLLNNYRAYHTKMLTVMTHLIGVPLVIFSLMVVLGRFHIGSEQSWSINLATTLTLILMAYYWWLDKTIGSLTNILMVVLCLAANLMNAYARNSTVLWAFAVCFVLGWAFQLLGHAIEGRKPALVDNFFVSIFIAPFFIVAEIRFGFKWSRNDLR